MSLENSGRLIRRFKKKMFLETPEGVIFLFELLKRVAAEGRRSLNQQLTMINNYKGVENVELYDEVLTKLRSFFKNRGFVEVNTQDRLSILAACEDPSTVATYNYAGKLWPLPQTGQMWLEYELLKRPELPGVFCVGTSYRAEKNPIPGRHKIIFPMFEFEAKGTIEDLKNLEAEALEHLGFGSSENFIHKTYDEMKEYYGKELTYKEENKMMEDFGPVVFLENFPISTSPFWNMKKNGEYAHKIDVILYGNETIGSAERSTDKEEMREQFETISGGRYAAKLYELFGQERVQKELNEFLSLDFFPRFGAGIGMSRLMDAYQK
ncbi:MAG TPA: amino acid--tRNA ligase-related protein [Candidatus Paceibacterota bacterium]|nr:amino acid--tRNA ligase-related protein [Candidatus Paceibacterota bacterium]